MTAPGKAVPSLEAMLTAGRPSPGPCQFARVVPPELRAEIGAKVAAGLHAWAVYERWLLAHGVDVAGKTISIHFARRHDVDA